MSQMRLGPPNHFDMTDLAVLPQQTIYLDAS